LGKHNLKDPRLDQADQLVEAKKKTYVQIDLLGEDALTDAEAILAPVERRADLILQDLELIETRLGRTPPESERAALLKLQQALEAEQFVAQAKLNPEESAAIAVHAFLTAKPIVVAAAEEFLSPDALLIRAYRESGYLVFLTVGGKENRAWKIRSGCTAWEAAGSIHSDIQKGFIRAEIIGWDDFVAHGGETGAKRAGKLRLETKSYVMQDCDVTNFRFNK
jgi:ribosome-binding ATPase YchF (GTP1/OBG family)